MFGNNIGKNAAAHIKPRCQPHKAWLHGFGKVVEDAIGHRLVKRSLIAVRPDIEFQAFQFDAFAVRHVIQIQGREIRLTGFRTQAGKLRYFHVNPIVARRLRIWKRVKVFFWRTGH